MFRLVSRLRGRRTSGRKRTLSTERASAGGSISLADDVESRLRLELPSASSPFHERLQQLLDKVQSSSRRDSTGVSTRDPKRLAELGWSSYFSFERSNNLDSINRAIDVQRRVIELMDDDHPKMLDSLVDLGVFIWTRYIHLEELGDLECAIATDELIVSSTPQDHPDLPARLESLAISLLSRSKRLDNLHDLEYSIAMRKLAVDTTPEGHVDRALRLGALATSLGDLYDRFNEPRGLEEAVIANRLAVNLIPGDNTERPSLLDSLAVFLRQRYERLGDMRDLEDALATHRDALRMTPQNYADRPLYLHNLALSLRDRFERLGQAEDLEDAIAADRSAIALKSENDPEQPFLLDGLGGFLRYRFLRFGEVRNLEEAISLHKLAIDRAPEGHRVRAVPLHNLALSLNVRFERFGEVHDLDEAIEADRRAVDAWPKDHPARPSLLNGLARSLRDRFERLGESDDLEKAISTHRSAIRLTPETHSHRAGFLDALAYTLRLRFSRFGEVDDIEEAIITHKLALELTPEGHEDRSGLLASLAYSLRLRYESSGQIDDLEESITAYQQALEITSSDHSYRPSRLNGLAVSLCLRFKHLGKIHDLKEAIAAHKLAIYLTPEGHPEWPILTYNLGTSLKAWFTYRQSKIHFDAVFDCYMKATTRPLGDPTARMKSARDCVSLLSEYPQFSSAEMVLDAHSRIIQVFPEIVWLGYSLQRRYEESAALGTETNATVSAFIKFQSRYQAIEWMEAGRSLIWSQTFSLRAPLGELERAHPGLAAELRMVSSALQQSGNWDQLAPEQARRLDDTASIATAPPSNDNTSESPRIMTTAADRHRELATEYDKVLKKVRNHPGFEDFLRPPRLVSLMPSIEGLDGPVVFINVHASSCDALALSPNGAIQHIALPDLTEIRARSLRGIWKRFLHASSARTRAVISSDKLASMDRSTTMCGTVLWKLWIWIVRPILQALNLMDDSSPVVQPLHVTWCPTGPLTQLPLHAAGIYDFSNPSRSQHVFDYVVSSYTPSLAALLRCRESSRENSSSPKVLVIAQPATEGYAPLPCTEEEYKRIDAVLPESKIYFLNDKDATSERTMSEMQKHAWVHLACHGRQDPGNPTQSAFALDDGPLTLSKLMGMVADDSELAFLSACETATGDEKIPEESAHLAAGMLAVGFKGVVATMWSIWDTDAPVIVEAYYKSLIKFRKSATVAEGYTGAAYALHDAMQVLREHVGEHNFVRWAPFVHFGV